MRPHILFCTLFTAIAFEGLSGCPNTPTKSVDVASSIHRSLDQAGLKNVRVRQDQAYAVVTLTGTVASAADKSRAGSIADSAAGPQVVANQIAVRAPGR
jgi:osmotically-inducible protein OsmY